MKNLTQLTEQYKKAFILLIKKVQKYGMDDFYTKYTELKEVCNELSIDTDGIEEKYLIN